MPMILAARNKFGNYEHGETGFLFCRDTHKVYGRQNRNGTIAKLTIKDYEKCRSLGVDFICKKQGSILCLQRLICHRWALSATDSFIIPDLLRMIY